MKKNWKLLLCPFCGTDDIVHDFRTIGKQIECMGCGVQITRDSEENVIDAWNRRSQKLTNVQGLTKKELDKKYKKYLTQCEKTAKAFGLPLNLKGKLKK